MDFAQALSSQLKHEPNEHLMGLRSVVNLHSWLGALTLLRTIQPVPQTNSMGLIVPFPMFPLTTEPTIRYGEWKDFQGTLLTVYKRSQQKC
jgi:hypothetical protein